MKYRRPKRRSQAVEDANSRLQHAVVRGESEIILNKLRKDLEKAEAKEKPCRRNI